MSIFDEKALLRKQKAKHNQGRLFLDTQKK